MKTTKQHEKEYFHLPKRSIKFIFSTILLLGLCFLFTKVTISSWNFLELGSLDSEQTYFAHQLLILPLLIFNYILINLTICSFTSMFKKLKNCSEKGLISGLILGLIFGLIGGLIGGLIVGLIGEFEQ